MKHIKNFLFLFLILLVFSCTKLDERFRGELEESSSGNVTPAQILTSAYNSMNGPFQTGGFWHAEEQTSDEVIAPTRGPDWDDNGAWRALHAHGWNADHATLRDAYNDLLSVQFAASNVLQFSPSAQQGAEARFIRALSMFAVLDGWDQVPYRADLSNFKELPETLKGTAAADFIASELTTIMGDLPDNNPDYVANKDAARALLMKVYLNRGVYANRQTPEFAAADMEKVIMYANEIRGTGKYSLSTIFFDNFAPDNDTRSKENIFTLQNVPGERGGNVRGTAFQVHHYNMNPGGWNGFATLSEFYDKFDANDQRRGMSYNTYPGALPNPGRRVNVGFLVGQQYDWTTDEPLKDRKGNPLVFTEEVHLRETGDNLEVTGIRVNKYPFDYGTAGDQKNNDWVIFRYADVLLMEAEALHRTGKEAEARDIVNQIRAARMAEPLTSLSLDQLIDERGREMYWEGWRRQDLIRFGKFLQPWQEKPASDPKFLLFPIPSTQLAVNANLTQNPGY